MPLFPSDFKKFKHVSSDDKTTTLEHPKGHKIVIMHKALSKDMQAQLKALSKAGKDVEVQVDSKAEGGMIEKATKSGMLGTQPQVTQEIEQGNDKYKHMQDYTGRSDVDVRTPEQKARAEEAAKQYGYAEGGDVVPDFKDPMAPTQETPSEQQNIDPDVAEQRQLYNSLIKSGTFKPDSEAPVDPVSQMFGPKGEAPQNFSPANWAQAQQMYTRGRADNAAQIAGEQQKVIQLNQARVSAGLQPLPVPNVPEGPQIPGSAENPPVPGAPGNPPPGPPTSAQPQSSNPIDNSMQDTEGMLKSGYQGRLAGIQQEAQAKGALGEQQAQVLQQAEQSQLQAKAAYQQHYNELEQERQNHMDDIRAGYVDPNKYWTGDKDGNGAHSKIAAGIGMILAGFNPTSSPNAAVNFLKFQMEKNMEAQAHNLGAKQNMLTANLRQFGNLRDASDMTRLMQNDIMQNELSQTAAKASNPMAKAAALQAAGQLKMEAAPLFQQFAMRRAMMGLANGGGSPQSVEHMLGYMRVMNPEMAKEMESRYVPGVGMASVPVPQEVRGQLVAKQQFGQAVNDLRDWAMKHSGSMSPSAIAEGQTKAANVQNLYRQGINGGVFKQGEQSFINGIIDSDPSKFFNSIRVLPKLNEAARENENSMGVLKKGYGLQNSPAQQAPQIKTVNGKKYMRGPSGEAIPIK